MTSSSKSTRSAAGSSYRKWLLILGGLIVLWMAVHFLPLQAGLQRLLNVLQGLGAWAPILFIVAYVLATVLFIPGSALTLGAGAVFGIAWGCVYVSLGSTLGAIAAFLIGRHWARDAIHRRMERYPRFAAIDQAVAREAWKVVLLTRLSPVFPFTLLNYAFGLTRVSLRDYALASWIGMIPGTVLYVYLGSLAKLATATRQRTPIEWSLYAVGLGATLVVTILITRRAKQALADRVPS